MPLLEERYTANGHRVQEARKVGSVDAPPASSRLASGLPLLVAFLGAIVAGAGLLWPPSGESFSVTTFRGQTTEIYGRGLYQNDTLFMVGNNRASDIVVLVVGIPLLVAALRLYSRGSFRAHLPGIKWLRQIDSDGPDGRRDLGVARRRRCRGRAPGLQRS